MQLSTYEVERRNTGTASQDRTGDYGRPASDWEFLQATKRHTAAFTASDLADECDDQVLELLKAGCAEEAGRQLALRMKNTIARCVARELS